MIIVQTDSNRPTCKFLYVGNRPIGFDWVERLGLAAKFSTRKEAEKALRTLGWNRTMADEVKFLAVAA